MTSNREITGFDESPEIPQRNAIISPNLEKRKSWYDRPSSSSEEERKGEEKEVELQMSRIVEDKQELLASRVIPKKGFEIKMREVNKESSVPLQRFQPKPKGVD